MAAGGALLMAPVDGYGEDHAPPPRARRRRTLLWVLLGALLAGLLALALALLLPAKGTVRVPDVTGRSELSAEVALKHAGLTPVPTLTSSSTAPPGIALAQTPHGGAVVDRSRRLPIALSRT